MLPRFDATLTRRTSPACADWTAPTCGRTSAITNFGEGATYANILAQIGVDRVAFSADYPFGSMRAARNFLDNLPLTHNARAAISHRNAAVLGL